MWLEESSRLPLVALNYLHDGFRGGDLALLGRGPNNMQKAIHKRLWSLLAACDSPGQFPLSPGRSGCEFIARFHLLEEFAKSCSEVSEDFYCDGPQDFEKPVPISEQPPKKAAQQKGSDPREEQSSGHPRASSAFPSLVLTVSVFPGFSNNLKISEEWNCRHDDWRSAADECCWEVYIWAFKILAWLYDAITSLPSW